MKNPFLRRRFFSSFSSNPPKLNPNPGPSSFGPRFLPIPHRTLPEPQGNDLDFVTVAHSHLVHADWPKLAAIAPSLTPFRATHLLLRLRHDPVLSLEFYQWCRLQCPSSQSIDFHAIVLHILTKARRFRSAESILKRILIPQAQNRSLDLFDAVLYSYRLSDSSPAVFDAVFALFAREKKFRNATETFRRMREYGFLPKIISCNAFMSSLLQFGRSDIVLSFYREMRRCRISPNVYTWNMVILALCNLGKLDKALELFAKMESLGFNPMESTFNTLIYGHCNNGLMNTAMKLKDAMTGKGLEPNVITYNSLIHGFCKEGRMHESYKLFSAMKAAELSPNTVTFNILIQGYSQMNNVEMSYKLYEEMVKNKVELDIVTYNALILGLCNDGKTKKADLLMKELVEKNIVPNATTFSLLIAGQCKRQNSERALKIYKAMKMSGFQLNSDTFGMLISTFCKNKDFEGAIQVLRDMLGRWIAPGESVLTELFEGLLSNGKMHLVTKLRSETDGARLIPDVYFSTTCNSIAG